MYSKDMQEIMNNLSNKKRGEYAITKEMEKTINQLCVNSCYTHWERNFLFEAAEKGFSAEQLKYICYGGAHIQEMAEIADGIMRGLSRDQLDVYSRKQFNVKEMRLLKNGLLNGQSINYMKFYGDNLLELRRASYNCSMIQSQIEFVKVLKKTGGEMSRSAKLDIEQKMQESACMVEAGIYTLLQTNADELIATALDKYITSKKKQKSSLVSKIKTAKKQTDAVKTKSNFKKKSSDKDKEYNQ